MLDLLEILIDVLFDIFGKWRRKSAWKKRLGTAAGITAGILVLAYIVLAYYR